MRSVCNTCDSKFDRVENRLDLLLSRIDIIDWKLSTLAAKTADIEAVPVFGFRSSKERFDKTQDAAKNSDVLAKLSENVTAIVGLKEAVSAKERAMKAFWWALLIGGIGLTIYHIYKTADEYTSRRSATNVQFDSNSTFRFPPLFLCADGWVDSTKANATGLSLDAVRYSLGYFDDYHRLEIENLSAARLEFLEYTSKNFIRLPEFYASIAEELSGARVIEDFAAAATSAYYCPRCDHNDQQKTFFVVGAGVCHKIAFSEALNGADRMSSNHVIAKVRQGHSEPYFKAFPAWYLYFSPDEQVELVPTTFLFLRPFTYTYIKVQAKRYVALENSKISNCVSKNDKLYSRLECLAKCEEELYLNRFGCRRWSRFHDNFEKVIDYTRYCNFLDKHQNESMKSTSSMHFIKNQSAACFAQCPHKCERMFYEVSIISQIDIGGADYDHIFGELAEQNMSAIHFNVLHNSVFEGGIITYSEVNTFTYVEFANNIGGTLGLFVGGTLLTLVQVLVFVVTVIFEKIRALLDKRTV